MTQALREKTRSELQEFYNGLPGAKPLIRLRNRAYALDAIWRALQKEPKRLIDRKKREGHQPRAGSKQEKLISLMRRKSGVTVDELTQKLGWQAHTCRGLISTMRSKGVVSVTTAKNRAGQTVYKAA